MSYAGQLDEKSLAEASETYYLRPDDATLLFFPSAENAGEHIVVQVLIMLAAPSDSSTVEMALDFYGAQREVTDAVKAILHGHIISGLPEQVTYEGQGFILHGTRKDWKYGRRLQLSWGEEELQPCADKWVFTFRTT